MIRFELASFKDPAGRVFYHEDSVCRTLTGRAAEHFESARSAGLVDGLVRQQLLVETELTSAGTLGIADLPFDMPILKQPRIASVTYPYEWSFEMLRDAALVTLRAMERCLADGFVLKDAPSFNVLFDGTIPRLIDAPSIEPHRSGAPWEGYEQFCRSFLFPLLLAAYRGLDVSGLLRASLGEISVKGGRIRKGPITPILLPPQDLLILTIVKYMAFTRRVDRWTHQNGMIVPFCALTALVQGERTNDSDPPESAKGRDATGVGSAIDAVPDLDVPEGAADAHELADGSDDQDISTAAPRRMRPPTSATTVPRHRRRRTSRRATAPTPAPPLRAPSSRATSSARRCPSKIG